MMDPWRFLDDDDDDLDDMDEDMDEDDRDGLFFLTLDVSDGVVGDVM